MGFSGSSSDCTHDKLGDESPSVCLIAPIGVGGLPVVTADED